MKHQSDYIETPRQKLFKKCGAFYAFSNKQFEEKREPNTKYIHLGHGLLVRKQDRDQLLDGLEQIQSKAIKQDLKDHTKKEIIWRELANHECHYDGELQPIYDKLLLYPITKEEIDKEYQKYYLYCCENDLF